MGDTTAVYTGTPIMTTLSGAKAAALGIAALKKTGYGEDGAGVSLRYCTAASESSQNVSV